MTKTSLEVITRAHRHIGILSVDEEPTADEYAYGLETLNAAFDELQAVQETAFTWDIETVPDGVFNSMALLVAVDVAPHYAVQAPVRRSTAIGRVRAFAFPDDRPDSRDYDGDGTVTEAEAEAGKRAEFY